MVALRKRSDDAIFRDPRRRAGLPVDRVVIDGEAVVLRGDGYCDFGALLERRASQQAVLVAFDLMQAGGEDLRPFPLAERRSWRALGVVL